MNSPLWDKTLLMLYYYIRNFFKIYSCFLGKFEVTLFSFVNYTKFVKLNNIHFDDVVCAHLIYNSRNSKNTPNFVFHLQ